MVGSAMNKCLITGGAGFIGFHLAKFLYSKGYDITICDNLKRGKMDNELRKFIDLDRVHFSKIDLTNKVDLNQLDNDYDQVYHLAAINGTKFFYEMPEEVLRVNVLSVINILDWFKDSKCGKILFSSSSETYASTVRNFKIKIPTPEDVVLAIEDITNSRWSYAGSKIIGELFFINYAKKYKLNFSIIRYHNIYGSRMGYEHVIPEFSMRIIKKEEPFKIYGGNETRAFCYVSDAVRATNMVLESNKTNNEIIHIGNNLEEIKIIDLAKKMFKIADFYPDWDIKPAPKGCVQRRCPDITKLQKLTGYKPRVNLDEGLKLTFDWYKTNS